MRERRSTRDLPPPNTPNNIYKVRLAVKPFLGLDSATRHSKIKLRKENARDVAASGRVACAEEARGMGIVPDSEPFAENAGGSVRFMCD
jgi:hypothetical protein